MSTFQNEEYLSIMQKNRQQYDRQRNIGKISNRDAKVGTLPPLKLPPCKAKACDCKVLLSDPVAQQRLRDKYVTTVRDATHSDRGNLLLLNYMFPAVQSTRKRKPRDPNSTTRTRNRVTYQVPRLGEDGSVERQIQLCKATFQKLFNCSEDRLTKLRTRRMDPDACLNPKTKKNVGKRGFDDTVKANLKAVLDTEPDLLESDDSGRYYFGGDVNRLKLWIKYLDQYGTEGDQEFLAQARTKNFYPTYHKLNTYSRYPQYSEEEPMLKPSVAYSSALKWWEQFDLNFEADTQQRRTKRKISLVSASHSSKRRSAHIMTPEEPRRQQRQDAAPFARSPEYRRKSTTAAPGEAGRQQLQEAYRAYNALTNKPMASGVILHRKDQIVAGETFKWVPCIWELEGNTLTLQPVGGIAHQSKSFQIRSDTQYKTPKIKQYTTQFGHSAVVTTALFQTVVSDVIGHSVLSVGKLASLERRDLEKLLVCIKAVRDITLPEREPNLWQLGACV